MKNSIITLCAAAGALALLTGCSSGLPFTAKPAPDFDKPRSMTARINCGKLEAAADVTHAADGGWTFSFTEPKTLTGLKLSLDDAGCYASLGALSFSAEESSVYTLIPDIIAQSVDSLSAVAEEDISSQDGVLTLDTDFDGQKVVVTAAEDTGELISLKCPYHKLAVYFSDETAPETEDCGLVETE